MVYAIENLPPGEGMRESTHLELVKDGNIKQGGFKCGMTVPGKWENTRPGGDMRKPGSEMMAKEDQSCRK